MKIFLIHPDPSLRTRLITWLEEDRGHVVLAAESSNERLLWNLARYEPDIAILPEDEEQSLEHREAPKSFPCCHFVFIQGSEEQRDSPSASLDNALSVAEAACKQRPIEFRRFASEVRGICHDEGYLPYASNTKRHEAVCQNGWKDVMTDQETAFVLQLQTARKDQRHHKAKRYLAVLCRFDRSLRQEAAYRLVHGSYKVAWLRDQIGRWATVLAHYIADAELEHCPAPQNASSRFVFIHHAMPLSFQYPALCVLRYGVRPAIQKLIAEAMVWRFTGESEEELIAIGNRLLGLNDYLSQLARAQVVSLEQFLNPTSEFHRVAEVPRVLSRSFGIYFDTWGWNYLHAMPANLREITQSHLAGDTWVDPGAELVSPSFYEFREIIATMCDETP